VACPAQEGSFTDIKNKECDFIACLGHSAIYKWLLPDQKEVLHFDDPTAVAISSLFSVPDSNAMLDSFLEAGGIPVVLKLLRETTCPTTLAHAVDLLVRMVSTHGRPNTPDRCQELADQLHDAGGSDRMTQVGQIARPSPGPVLQYIRSCQPTMFLTARSCPNETLSG
jgi:hypothetical protein